MLCPRFDCLNTHIARGGEGFGKEISKGTSRKDLRMGKKIRGGTDGWVVDNTWRVREGCVWMEVRGLGMKVG